MGTPFTSVVPAPSLVHNTTSPEQQPDAGSSKTAGACAEGGGTGDGQQGAAPVSARTQGVAHRAAPTVGRVRLAGAVERLYALLEEALGGPEADLVSLSFEDQEVACVW